MPSILTQYAQKFFKTATITIQFRDKILAGIPRSGDMLDYFVKSKHMSDADKEEFLTRVRTGALTDEEKEAVKSMAWCQFESDAGGNLCLWHGNIKAMLREMFTTQGLTQKRPKTAKKGEDGKESQGASAGGRQTFQHAVHVDPIRIPFIATLPEIYYTKPDGYVDRIKHISDASGQRSAIGRHDYLDRPKMRFTLKWPANGVFTEDEIKQAMAAAQEDGLGASRSQGFGKFDVIEWE